MINITLSEDLRKDKSWWTFRKIRDFMILFKIASVRLNWKATPGYRIEKFLSHSNYLIHGKRRRNDSYLLLHHIEVALLKMTLEKKYQGLRANAKLFGRIFVGSVNYNLRPNVISRIPPSKWSMSQSRRWILIPHPAIRVFLLPRPAFRQTCFMLDPYFFHYCTWKESRFGQPKYSTKTQLTFANIKLIKHLVPVVAGPPQNMIHFVVGTNHRL